MRWAATEESNGRVKESRALRDEIQRLHITREEALGIVITIIITYHHNLS
jgi:hypothetical protein